MEWKLPHPSSNLNQQLPETVAEGHTWPNSVTSNQVSQAPSTIEFNSETYNVGVSNVGFHSGTSSRKQSKMEQHPPLDDAQVVQIATEAFIKELGLEDDSLLKGGKVQIREVPAGTYLMKEESHKV